MPLKPKRETLNPWPLNPYNYSCPCECLIKRAGRCCVGLGLFDVPGEIEVSERMIRGSLGIKALGFRVWGLGFGV